MRENVKEIHASRQSSLAVLALVYTLAFLISPYWILTRSPIVMAALLATILVFGAAWCFCAAGQVKLHLDLGRGPYFILVVLAIFILNFRTLTSVIPWRGDEGIHIGRVLDLAQKTPLSWILYFAGLCALTLMAAWRRSRWAWAIAALVVIAAIAFGLRGEVFVRQDRWIVRYPLVNYWLFLLVPKLAAPVFGLYRESLYRFVPVFAMAGVAWSFQRTLAKPGSWIGFLWALGAATIPVVYYYSSILYIEPVAVWLMFIVCLHIRDLLHSDHGDIQGIPAWYALILIGFIKETTLPFLLLFILCRFAVQWRRNVRTRSTAQPAVKLDIVAPCKPWRSFLLGEARVMGATLLPMSLFYFLRSTLARVRSFDPGVAALMNPAVYRAIGQSFVEQFGSVLIPFALGCALLVRRRDYSSLFFLCAVVIGFPMLTAVDSGGIYAGYSRLNLLVLPPVLVLASIGLKHIIAARRSVAALAACALIAINVPLSPIRADGTKLPFWGNYLADTSEHYYPYRDALAWLKPISGNKRILFAGLDYGYPFDFYFDQLAWHPRYKVIGTPLPPGFAGAFSLAFSGLGWHPLRQVDSLLTAGDGQGESALLADVLRYARDAKFHVVMYQVLGTGAPTVRDSSGFRRESVFKNEAHTLLVFFQTE